MSQQPIPSAQRFKPDIIFLGNEVLTLIEIEEAKLLSWGFIQGSIDLPTQLPALLAKLPRSAQELWQSVQTQGYSESDILDSLLKRQLVFRLADGTFRSRFAEAVRLLFLLRQRFSDLDWATAPKLVSDLKLELKRRTYPRRSISPEALDARLQAVSPTPLQQAVIHQLLQSAPDKMLSLARFQAEAVERQLLNLRQSRNRGVVIGAGTGAGKTKAFYIPAFAHIAEAIDLQQPYLQALAIYPRNELLKDQLTEAFIEARKLDRLLTQRGKRPISIGAYFGDTPNSPARLIDYGGWERSQDGRGYVCPYFNCTRDPNHILVWEISDIKAEIAANKRGRFGEHTRLRCTSCNFETVPWQLALTRQQMRNAPPDILFTSTEMLNRRLSNTEDSALFGIRQKKPPRLLLLDEIHTYEGITGAQISYLLRRWRHARGQHPTQTLCISGLSATLTDAAQFFARLTGIPEHDIDYIAPKDEDLIEEGMEYNLVVKGDPVSGTSLLATTIQTAMLLGRVLDPLAHNSSSGAFGKRIFAFTDKLDVINRWYQSMFDAEFNKKLSQYRLPKTDRLPSIELRKAQGQVWDLCTKLGHDLSQCLTVSRTTSQDPGVNKNSALVIATSTLEVGFNDPTVGAVLQHKAPRSVASFLQRKGRAGRVRVMRPWTVVVTSAYGRDRWAFQHAEELFNPMLPPIDLPIENYYVRKIQAAFALMDWAASELEKSNQSFYVWQLLSTGTRSEKSDYHKNARKRLRNLLLDILQGNRRADFEKYLQQALGMDGSDPAFHNVLWGEPRSLFYEVIPTVLRQLETNWRKVSAAGSEDWEDTNAAYPMPDFVPPTLFGDLNLPEIQLILPATGQARQNHEETNLQSMAIAQAMVEFAPGRASKRYVTQYRKDVAHWLALPEAAQLTRGVLNLAFLPIQFDELPQVVAYRGTAYKVYRPRVYTLSELPKGIRTTAYAELVWRTHIEISLEHASITFPRQVLASRSPWSKLLLSMRSFTQAKGTWVQITRFAVGVETELRFNLGEKEQRRLRFEDRSGDPNSGIGYTFAADAIQFTLAPLDIATLHASPAWPELRTHFGPAFFRYRLRHDPRLYEAGLSSFEIDWLWQLELSMLTATAVSLGVNLAEAAALVMRNRRALADRTLRAIFQSQLSSQEQLSEAAADVDLVGRLHLQLLEHMDNEAVVTSVAAASAALWNDSATGFDEWIEECYTSSIGATLLTALTRLVPDIDPDDLALDIDGQVIWISEITAGGVGHISKLTEAITQHPRHFELQLNDVVHHCDRSDIAHQLRHVTQLISQGNIDLSDAFSAVRATTDLASLTTVKEMLECALRQQGIPPARSVLVGLNTKYLRPNSGPDSDRLIVNLVETWEQQAERLGTEIDLRVMAVAAPKIPAIAEQVTQLFARINPGQPADDNQVFNLLQSMLWLNCHDSCPECIETWQPFQPLVFPSRALLASLLASPEATVEFGSPTWQPNAQMALSAHFEVQISCLTADKAKLKAGLASLLTLPLEIGYQTFYPFVERVFQQGNRWVVQLAIRELIDA